jgi:hypothetical protein
MEWIVVIIFIVTYLAFVFKQDRLENRVNHLEDEIKKHRQN